MTYGTTHHALLDRAQLRAGETLLVLGAAGGVGTAAIQIGKSYRRTRHRRRLERREMRVLQVARRRRDHQLREPSTSATS
jgi:NADPH:quinone reductase-like Zn-dependent oxidoreductase